MTAVEVCCETPDQAVRALKAGADRVEICENLQVGGVTPGVDFRRQIQEFLAANTGFTGSQIRVLVRPSGGGFIYEAKDWLEVISQVEAISGQIPGCGLVVGGLNQCGKVPFEPLEEIRRCVRENTLVFHRAIDTVTDRKSSLETLMKVGFDGLLTSGGPDGSLNMHGLWQDFQQVDGKMRIIASGGIRQHNIGQVAESGNYEIHFRGPEGVNGNEFSEFVSEMLELARLSSPMRK